MNSAPLGWHSGFHFCKPGCAHLLGLARDIGCEKWPWNRSRNTDIAECDSTRHWHTRITETHKDAGVVVRGIVEPEFQPQVKVAELFWEVQESQFPGRVRLGNDQAVDQGKCASSCQLPFAE